MKIALFTSEAVPFAKTGGLADVCGALPLALEDLGQDVVVVMPKYQCVAASGAVIKKLNGDFDCTVIGHSVPVYFLKHDMYLRGGVYGDRFGDYPDNLKRFSYFCAKALALFQKTDFRPDVLHCHDWQTALIPMLTKVQPQTYFSSPEKAPGTLLTIHNVSYQGLFSREQMPDTGLGWEHFSVQGLEFYNKINLLKGGIQFADLLTTVSTTHAREIQTPEYGCGLEGVLAGRKDFLSGIVNGVDYKLWNPQGDGYIHKRYSADTIEDKNENKLKFQETYGLAKNLKAPLFGFVGRLVEQKGIDLILRVLPEMCKQGMQAALLGTGEGKYEAALFDLAQKYPGLVFVRTQFDDELAHRIYASSDFFLMPSRFEPCGIGQMIGFKYGTIPVVFKTGGLADTVIDFDLKSGTGTGFVFTKYEGSEFLLTLRRAGQLFSDAKKMKEAARRVMKLNFSWKESAKKYIELYERTKRC